jgi:two-component system, cell cycle sensor histidine kinase and response regulator CckA
MNHPIPMPEAAPPGKVADRTILVVDDDAPLRRVVEKILLRTGYRVLTADGPAQAIALARTHDGPIHGLVTDLLLPGRGGWELAQEVQRLRPGLPVVFMSGYDRGHVTERRLIPVEEALRVDLLQKPFAAGDLTRRIASLLEGPGGV